MSCGSLGAPRAGSKRRARALLLGVVLLGPLASADNAGLARVGPLQIDENTFTRRAAELAPFQWAELGPSWQERRRAFLMDVLIRDTLLDAQALGAESELREQRDAALSQSLLRELAAHVSASSVSETEIASYYEQHRRHYQTPRSLLLWRILVREEAPARALIHELGRPTLPAWSQAARERSVDEATHMRGGSLGYVTEQGETHMPQVRVARGLFEAADRVKDGELVPEPVREGDAFAVIWRRGSRATQIRSLSEVSSSIRSLLMDGKLAGASRSLIERLRKSELLDYHPERLDGFEPPLAVPSAPAPVVPPPVLTRPVKLLPEASERGWR
jgi:peptidyl-prolyl cis-trans isomerase C